MKQGNHKYRENLKKKMDEFVKFAYCVTKKFPKEELYGITPQIRKASLSVILNYIEGFARRKPAVQLNFFETSYGSLKESEYILELSLHERYLVQSDHAHGAKLAGEIGAMLWTEISALDRKVQSHRSK